MERAARIGGAVGTVTAVGQPHVEWSGRARRWGGQQGRVLRMDRMKEGSR